VYVHNVNGYVGSEVVNAFLGVTDSAVTVCGSVDASSKGPANEKVLPWVMVRAY
jgi:hypothetical protein